MDFKQEVVGELNWFILEMVTKSTAKLEHLKPKTDKTRTKEVQEQTGKTWGGNGKDLAMTERKEED